MFDFVLKECIEKWIKILNKPKSFSDELSFVIFKLKHNNFDIKLINNFKNRDWWEIQTTYKNNYCKFIVTYNTIYIEKFNIDYTWEEFLEKIYFSDIKIFQENYSWILQSVQNILLKWK